jgi:hypothetical protein
MPEVPPVVIRKILNHLREKSSLDSVVQLPKVSAGSAALDAKYVYSSNTTHKKSRTRKPGCGFS